LLFGAIAARFISTFWWRFLELDSARFSFALSNGQRFPGKPHASFMRYRGSLMKKLAFAIAAIALVGTPAFAADMAVKAPPPPPAPVYSWTGWYVGGNVGYSWGNANTDLTGNGNVTNSTSPSGILFTRDFNFGGSNSTQLNGVIGGGQIGYNYQFSPNGVLGLEADVQGSGERGSSQFSVPFSVTPCFAALSPTNCFSNLPPVNGVTVTSYQAKIDWFGTVRGRLGMLVGDQLLIYATGGLAYGEVGVSGNEDTSAVFSGTSFTPSTTGFSASKTNVGYTIGGGMEGRLAYWLPPNWTWKLEYLYLDLGSLDTANSFALLHAVNVNPTLNPTGTINTHTHFMDNIVRVGLNYHFN
jgi:outer membrane immunogenic protein